jgi:PAS domain S-box-containing protein
MGKMSEAVLLRNYRIFSAFSAASAVVAGILVMVGWWLHIPLLTSIVPGLATMKPNSALGFLLSGTALWLLGQKSGAIVLSKRVEVVGARICAALVVAIGAASACERLFGWELGIDELLFRRTLLATNLPNPGLMAQATAVAFIFLGTAILLLEWETRRKRRPAQALALITMVIATIAIFGYIYGVRVFGVSAYATIAIHTAALFLLLGAGILSSHPDRGITAALTSDGLGGLMARRLLPLVLTLPVLIGWIRLQGQHAGLYGTEFGLALFTASNVIIIAAALWTSAVWLNRTDLARRQAEERDEQLAAIVHSSSEAMVGKTLDGTITSWNNSAQRLYGYSEEEAIGQNVSILSPNGDSAENSVKLDDIRKGLPIENFETMRRRKDKVLIHVSLTISPVRDREGNVIAASTVARDITARKQAEERLRQSQTQLKGIIDSAMDAVITVDQDQRVMMFNAAAEKMFGYPAKEIVGRQLANLIPQNLRGGHAEHIRNFGETGTTNRTMGAAGTLKALRKDGTEFPIEASISQVKIGGEKLFTAIVRDVTERVRAERALREQASILDLTQVLVRDMDDRIVLWNRGAEKLYGYTLEEALGRSSHGLLRTEFPEPLNIIQERLMRTGEWEGELVHRKRDGSRIVVASVWTLERHLNGQPWRILEANTDITARKRAEEAVKLAQARLLSALEGGRMGTWVWDINKNTVDWDDAMGVLFGRSPSEMTGGSIEPFFSWLHPQDRERTRTAIEKALREGTNHDSEYRIHRPDGSLIWITSRGKVERDAQGNAFRMTGISVDVTDRKKMEEQLLQSQKMESLGTLAGGIAHDFNNILLAIGGNASMAIEDLAKDHPVQQSLQEIAKAGARASSLVRQILAFSRRQAPDRKRITVQPVVEEAIGMLRATLPARVEIRSNCAPDLPAIAADSTQLHQVIMNLCTNAARAMGEQGGILEVSAKPFKITVDLVAQLARVHEGNYVRLSVSDNGCGMEPAIVERIFDPFFTTQSPGQGTGLGLSVVHGIMKDHDGSISVYSEPGKGSIFHLYFPADGAATEKAREVAAPPRGNGEHLLYVDDEEALVVLATRSLGRLGYQITGHTDPVLALQAFRENPECFAAVVTDLSMPTMSGAELAHQVLAIRPDIPVVMTSGYIRPEDELEARRLGVRELILKPDTIEELAKALHRVFSGVTAERLT